jgi:hypothetical protein
MYKYFSERIADVVVALQIHVRTDVKMSHLHQNHFHLLHPDPQDHKDQKDQKVKKEKEEIEDLKEIKVQMV